MIGSRIAINYVTYHSGQARVVCLDGIRTSTNDPEFPALILLEHGAARHHRVRGGIHGDIVVDRPIDIRSSSKVEQLRNAGTRLGDHPTGIVWVWSCIPTYWSAETGLVNPTQVGQERSHT